MPVSSLICGAAALIPAVWLVRYFVQSDKYPEPSSVLWGTFWRGFWITVPIVVLELVVSGALGGVGGPIIQALITSFLVAALCEEGCKYLVLDRYCGRQADFDEPMDAVVYGVVVSMGFATFENIMYVWNGGLGVALARSVTAMPAHACFGALMGYNYALRRFNWPGKPAAVPVLAAPILVHGLYDTPLFMMQTPFVQDNGLVALGMIVFFLGLLVYMYKRTRGIVGTLRALQDAPPAAMTQV